MATILLLNGPNLNLLGMREPGIYGQDTLQNVVANLIQQATNLGHTLEHCQSNSENTLIEKIHSAPADNVAFILINPAAYTHTSVALRDALSAVAIPFIEIHISNVYAREEFRKRSYFTDIAVGVISGLGTLGYQLALEAAHAQLQHS